MKRNFTHENFEDFLRHSADGLRMRPSEDVWKGISGRLKKKRTTGGILQASFFLLMSLFSYLVVSNTSQILSSPNSASTEKIGDGNNSGISTNTPARTAVQANSNLSSSTSSLMEQTETVFNSSADEEGVPAFTAIPGGLFFEPQPVDSYEESREEEKEESAAVSFTAAEKKDPFPLTIESVVNSYKRTGKSRWDLQFYFTPTMSYRKLSENKAFLRSDNGASYSPSASQSVNSAVTHKPDLGLEVGFTSKYALTKNLKLRAGVQMNINRYDIKVYESPSEVATIMFNGGNNRDSINMVTGYSNRAGYDQEWIQNTYLSVSVPIGVEVKIAGNENVQFGVATTIQPTYVLGDRAFLITTDYKNYAELPHLTRRFNVNTSFETFVGYSTGKLNWQVGPQVRYQLLSSFISKYPVKENLFDFGLRVGVSLNK